MTQCPLCAREMKKKEIPGHLLAHADKYQEKEAEYYNLGKWAMREYELLKNKS